MQVINLHMQVTMYYMQEIEIIMQINIIYMRMIIMFYKIRVLLSIIDFMCLNKDFASLIMRLFKMNIDSMSLINVSTNNNTNSSLIKIDSMGLNITTWNIFTKTNTNNVIPALLVFE